MSESKEAIWKKSQLWQSQKDAGATFSNSNGWEMAEEFEGVQKEVHNVRSNVGLIDLSFAGAIPALCRHRLRLAAGHQW